MSSGVRNSSMKVTSLWIFRTSKIFFFPSPTWRFQLRRVWASSHDSHSGPNFPRFHRSSMSKFRLCEPGITQKQPSPTWFGVSIVTTFTMGEYMVPFRTVYSSVGSPLCHPVAPRPSYFEIDHVLTSCGSPMNSLRYGSIAGCAIS